jgi:hypothetical protein
MNDSNAIPALAQEFVRLIRDQLTSEQLETVIARNRSSQDGCCATIEVCNAYELMASAFLAIVGRNLTAGSRADGALMSAAWAVARSTEFVRTIEYIESNAIGDPAFAYSVRDFLIEDPTVTECGRFEIDPTEEYGLRPQEVSALVHANAWLEARRAEAPAG